MAPLRAPALALLLLLAPLAGCAELTQKLGIESKSDCGPKEVLEEDDSPWADVRAENRSARAWREGRFYSWWFGAELACRDQHVKYAVEVIVAPGDPSLCAPGDPLVTVKERASFTGSDHSVAAEPDAAGRFLFEREGEVGLAQAAEDIPWLVTVEVWLPAGSDAAGASTATADACAVQRITQVDLWGSYLTPRVHDDAPT